MAGKKKAQKKKAEKTAVPGNGRCINRELSWLQFNGRVLEEARDTDNPLFERVKFLAISASNLDEFVMVRMASLYDLEDADIKEPDIAGLLPKEQIAKVTEAVHAFTEEQYNVYRRMILPALHAAGVEIAEDLSALSAGEQERLDRYFDEEVYPVLTPMAVDAARPFPLVRNRAVYIGALVREKKKEPGETDLCLVQVPEVLPRLYEVSAKNASPRRFVLLEDVIARQLEKLFLNYDILCRYPFRVLRSADLEIDEDDAPDLLIEIENRLKQRRWGDALRMEVPSDADRRLVQRLSEELQVEEEELYRLNGPPDLTFLQKLYAAEGFSQYKEKRYRAPWPHPAFEKDGDIFEELRQGDVLLHHPYDSFSPVVRFIEQAAQDERVLAIKQTLYRVSADSPIIAALAFAAERGKQVFVLVELKARFDEENNIVWARRLEKAGCHVIYGLTGLKTHCKITLIVRRDDDGIRRYVHLGTGNYNDSTARLYTDLGMFTCKEAYGADATAVFNMLSGYSEPRAWNRLILAPLWLKERLLYLIRREGERAAAGEPAHIIAKMNALCHAEVIDALYAAAAAGAEIDLIVRGICSLRTDLPECEGRIRVRSIVGNFLEHSRVFYFENGYQPELYLASADWMIRNLERRVEIMFPVEDEALRAEVKHILETELADTEKARVMLADGRYGRVDKRGKKRVNAQRQFCEDAAARARHESAANTRVFHPRTPKEKEG
ncbi:MAG: polyphosphate kinase 1 [Lachnospiraceae bacterium]|nr:polyphosphate kinase 1 [Lachnospiraceae bacterium]